MELSSLIRETPQLTLRPLQPEDYAAFLSGFRACGPARNRFDDGQFDLSFLTEDWYAGLLARRQREAEADISYVLNLFRREDGASVGYCDITTQQREAFQWGRIGCTVLNPYWGPGLRHGVCPGAGLPGLPGTGLPPAGGPREPG